jgi:hypothetical protein
LKHTILDLGKNNSSLIKEVTDGMRETGENSNKDLQNSSKASSNVKGKQQQVQKGKRDR